MCCGKPLEREQQEYCRDCQRREAAFEQGRSVWLHQPPVSQGIYKFKYQNKRYYGQIFASEMAGRYKEQIRRWGIEEIVPVPLHTVRKRKRGFNQAEILACELGKRLDIPVNKSVLYRVLNTKPQKGLDDTERVANLKGAFGVARNSGLQKHVLLVDDIYTTGNTIHRTAKLLRLAGAEKVYFLTISIGQGL